MAKVDVIIPTYNRSEFLQSAISSVLNQTFEELALIVVDDASKDNTQFVVNSFKDKRIEYIQHPVNRGEAVARNTGVSTARAEFVAFLDDDDEWLPEKLRFAFDLLKNSPAKVGGVYTGYFMVEQLTGLTRSCKRPERRGDIYLDMARGNVIGTPSAVLLRRECFEKVGVFDQSIPWMLDYDMWIRIAKEFHFECIKEPLIKYHVHKNQISNNASIRAKGLEAILSKHRDFFSLDQTTHSRFYYDLGLAYGESKQFGKAWKAVLKATELNPFGAGTYFKLLKLVGLSLSGPNNYMRLRRRKNAFMRYFRSQPTKEGEYRLGSRSKSKSPEP
jgi:glycosyltransferase involved in cell wall biosynthesis